MGLWLFFQLILLFLDLFLYLLLLILLLLIILIGFSSLLPLFELIQALRLRSKYSNLLLDIGVGLHQAVKHDSEVIVELDLLLLEELWNEPGLFDREASKLLQMIC